MPGVVVVLTDPHRLPEVEAARVPVILAVTPRPRICRPSASTTSAWRSPWRFAPSSAGCAPTGIHPTCVIGSRAQIGKSVFLGPCVVIGDDVTIGERAQIHAHSVIEHGVQIGRSACSILVRRFATVRSRRTGGDPERNVIGSDGFGYAQDAHRRHVAIPRWAGSSSATTWRSRERHGGPGMLGRPGSAAGQAR